MRGAIVFLALLTVAFGPAACQERVAVLTTGADQVCLRLVEEALKASNAEVVGVTVSDVESGALLDEEGSPAYSALVIPGGSYESLASDRSFVDALKEYLEAGGLVVGIAEGGDLLVRAGLVPAELGESAPAGYVRIHVVNPMDPAVKDVEDGLEVYYDGCPVPESTGAAVPATFEGGALDGKPAILRAMVGQGQVLVFVFHPCHLGSTFYWTGAKMLLDALNLSAEGVPGAISYPYTGSVSPEVVPTVYPTTPSATSSSTTSSSVFWVPVVPLPVSGRRR